MPAHRVGRPVPRLADPSRGAARRWLTGAALAAALLASAPAVSAQPPPAPGEDASARAFVEALRRKDPVAAARFQALREARERSVTELRAAETRYAAGGPELRAAFLAKLRGARRAYAETSLAILDFLDDRDTTTLTEYQAAIAELRALLEQRKQTRAELEKLLGDD